MSKIVQVTVNGRKFNVTPCSAQHRDNLAAGYITVSCRKCVLERVDATGGEATNG